VKTRFRVVCAFALAASAASVMAAGDQTVPGGGNGNAVALAGKSPMVRSAVEFLLGQASRIQDQGLRRETLDAISNPRTCVAHRRKLTDAQKEAILADLVSAGLVNPADAAAIPGGLKAGVFPPVLEENTDCPQLPQAFFSAPGSASIVGHHSYPGGLPIHEANNDIADVHLASEYRQVYGHSNHQGFPSIDPRADLAGAERAQHLDADILIDEDLILAAPLWHDWAKAIVFQWNADGTEFAELNFGGNGVSDNFGAPGDSRTGAHHIITIAEEMKRGLSPALVITMASAHSAPTSGNEYKVVNWLRAAALLAQIDPVAKGYLHLDAAGHPRLPALRQLGNGVDLNAAGQTNVLAEYTLHNLSDADFTYSGPAVVEVNVILKSIAPEFGVDPTDANYTNAFRNPVLSFLTAERLLILYSEKGTAGVAAEVQTLRAAGLI
jgi:hypothetical protein